MTDYCARYGWLPDGLAQHVRLRVIDGRIAGVIADAPPTGDDVRLPGIVLPGFANTHSHAFHRALRGRTHDQGGTFWTWREQMYEAAARLEPESYLALARATYAEMALAGITCVGEFHYLHHRPDGSAYPDPNAMGRALVQAASEAGIRSTLLDTCYLAGGLSADGYAPLDARQARFSDGSAAAWADRVNRLTGLGDHARLGSAIHSVRAVPRDQLALIAAADPARPLHVHLSEQPAENEQCRAAFGMTPTELLAEAGVLSARTTAVHATHVSDADIELLAAEGTAIAMCPSTERDLGDGIGPAGRLARAGAPIVLGSDQHAVIDLLAEAQALELDQRTSDLERGRFTPAELMRSLTEAGHDCIGWPDAGRLAVGARADLVAVRLDTVRTAGVDPAQVVMVATSADIDTVIVDGRVVVRAGRHVLGDVGALLEAAISPLR